MAAQLSMWEQPVEDASPAPVEAPALAPVPGAHILRPYQEEAVVASLRELDNVQSTFVVMPTGSGKSLIFTEIAKRRPKDRILFLAHRDELLQQAVGHFERNLGEKVGLDQAQFFGGDERIIVGSVQTVSMPARLERFPPSRFDLVMTDECFPASTMVSTPTGSRPIEAIREGDRVLAWDEGRQMVVEGIVGRTMKRKPRSLVSITHENGILVCTPNHPVLTPYGWKVAGALESGCMVASLFIGEEGAGSEEGCVPVWSRVDRVEVQEQEGDGRFEGLCRDGFVYNFEVEGLHTYVANRVIVHNCHHSVSPSYRRILDYFTAAKQWGCTATADRLDEKAMGNVFDSCAYLYEIEDAIRDGWLCDVRCVRIKIAGLDLSRVKTVAGDLNQGELDAVMAVEEVLLGVADATIREAGSRPTVLFATSVSNADKLAEILNRHRPGCAKSVNGKTESEERRAIMADFKSGRFQFLAQVAIATEGWDAPTCACIAMARPTKSRAFYAQAAGRAMRPHPSKPDGCLILDFCGNSGRHKLVSALDVLGGRYTEEEEELAQEFIEKNPGARARDALDAAHAKAEREKQLAEEAAKRAAIKAHAIYTRQTVDPFSTLHLDVKREQEISERFGGKQPSEKQIHCLEKFKIPLPKGCTSQLASKLIGAAIARRQKNLASFGQLKTLQRAGINEINISFSRASQVIDALASNGWKPLPFQKLDAILHRQRQPGED